MKQTVSAASEGPARLLDVQVSTGAAMSAVTSPAIRFRPVPIQPNRVPATSRKSTTLRVYVGRGLAGLAALAVMVLGALVDSSPVTEITAPSGLTVPVTTVTRSTTEGGFQVNPLGAGPTTTTTLVGGYNATPLAR
jgi:hypothetical protein